MKLKNGLYSATFGTTQSLGHGVVMLKDGEFKGGDNGFYYTGHYKTHGKKITSRLTIDRHSGKGSIRSVFGVDKMEVSLTGISDGDTIRLSAFEAGLGFATELKYICP